MEDMSVGPAVSPGTRRAASASGDAPRDLRDWIARCEAIGQIKRITEPVWQTLGFRGDAPTLWSLQD